MHFFNPVPLMRLVEIIPGLKTAAWVSEALLNLARRMAREPVPCTDRPAFLVNHVGRAFVPEAQRLLSEGIASVADIDRILTGATGVRIGPFALADRVGIDVQHAVMNRSTVCFTTSRPLAPAPSRRSASPRVFMARRPGLVVFATRTQENRAGRCRGADGASKIGLAAPKPAARRAAGSSDRVAERRGCHA